MARKQGFNLIEMVIYIAILSVVSIFVVDSLFKILEAFYRYRVSSSINTSAAVAMERMVREIRLADDIVVGSSVFDANPGHLFLNTIDPVTETATTIEFFASGNELMVKKGSGAAVALTHPDLELENLIFRQIATFTNMYSKAVKIELELMAGRGRYQKTINFYDTAVLRRSYGQ